MFGAGNGWREVRRLHIKTRASTRVNVPRRHQPVVSICNSVLGYAMTFSSYADGR